MLGDVWCMACLYSLLFLCREEEEERSGAIAVSKEAICFQTALRTISNGRNFLASFLSRVIYKRD